MRLSEIEDAILEVHDSIGHTLAAHPADDLNAAKELRLALQRARATLIRLRSQLMRDGFG
jgi:hypothetical protein